MRPGSDTAALLRELRVARGFDVAEVIEAKVGRLHRWFAAQDLDAAVVGVSGGIDSAVVLALLQRLAATAGSPLRRVVALVLPIERSGATGQAAAADRGAKVAAALGAECWIAPLGDAQDAAVRSLEAASGLHVDPWAAGQLLSVLRTPALYGAVALLRSVGRRAVVVGTTNRDEGAYLGFFGKGSDAMVDLQPISDLHKSEVVAIARELGVPDDIIAAPPTGDVWDGRADAEMIGATYDEVELVLRLRELGFEALRTEALSARLADGDALRRAVAAVEALHLANAHKYAVGSPAVHLDVLPRGIPGGWPDEVLSGRDEHRPAAEAQPGAWAPPPIELDPVDHLPAVEALASAEGTPLATLAHHVLTDADCARLVGAMAQTSDPEPVGVTGGRGGAAPSTIPVEVGSLRSTAWAPDLAAALWARLHPAVRSVRFLDPFDATDGYGTDDRTGHRTWRAVGLSPVLRFMRYAPGGHHLGHYDAGFDYGDGRRTLVSVVFFLTATEASGGGATRFARDGQERLEVWRRDHDDWTRATRAEEVELAVPPSRGAALLFDHRRCHDVERWSGPGDRVIIRADIVYEAVPDGRARP